MVEYHYFDWIQDRLMFSFLSVWKHLLAVALLHCSVYAQATIGVEQVKPNDDFASRLDTAAGLAIAVEWEEASSWKHLSVL